MRDALTALYTTNVMFGNALQSVLLLIFRLYWGWQFFETGKGKLLNHPQIAQFFASLHIPFPNAMSWFIGGLECVGGLLILVGLCTRPVGLLLSAAMIVAYLAVPSDAAKVANIFHKPDAFLAADPFFFLLTAALMFCFGPGLISLDALLKRTVFRNHFTGDDGSGSNHSGWNVTPALRAPSSLR